MNFNNINVYAFSAILSGFVSFELFCDSQRRSCMLMHPEYKIKHNIPLTVPICIEQHQLAYDTLKLIDAAFVKNDIKYRIIAGSALGYERHQGIIPWDDDIDIGCDTRDFYAVLRCISKLSLEGKIDTFVTRMWWGGVQINGCVDIFFFENKNPDGEIFTYDIARARKTWPNEYFSAAEFSNLKRVKFGPVDTFASVENMTYIQRAFGQNCLTECYVKPPHGLGLLGQLLFRVNRRITKQFNLTVYPQQQQPID